MHYSFSDVYLFVKLSLYRFLLCVYFVIWIYMMVVLQVSMLKWIVTLFVLTVVNTVSSFKKWKLSKWFIAFFIMKQVTVKNQIGLNLCTITTISNSVRLNFYIESFKSNSTDLLTLVNFFNKSIYYQQYKSNSKWYWCCLIK